MALICMEKPPMLREEKKRNRFTFAQSKYLETCLTCKIRKKKCSKEHPVCADCKRLGKNCVWVNSTMTVQQIREMKAKVENQEKKSRLKRKLDSQLKNIPVHKVQKIQSSGSTNTENGDFDGFSLLEFGSTNAVGMTKDECKGYGDPQVTESNENLEYVRNWTEAAQTETLVTSPLSFTPSGFNFFDDISTLLEQHKVSDKSRDIEIYDTNSSNNHQILLLRSSRLGTSAMLNSSGDISDTFPYINIIQSPSIPKPFCYGSFPELNDMDIQFYDYAVNHLLKDIGIVSDNESSHYKKLYLPLASVNQGVFYALLSWAAHYKGGHDELGKTYLNKSLGFMDSSIAKDENDRLQKLVNSMILMTSQICKGDVSNWFKFLKMGAEIIKDNGGISSFNKNKQQFFLVSSFSYHDVLSTATCERGTCFPLQDYQEFFLNEKNQGPDPLQGVSRPVFNAIGRISNLAAESRRLLSESIDPSLEYVISNNYHPTNTTFKSEDETPSKHGALMGMMAKASELGDYIDHLQPNVNYLDTFTAKELELQLTLFELFQYAAKLHLRLSVLKLNPSSLGTRLVLFELLKSLSIVMKSKVEGSLCFPVFIAGINAINQTDRELVLKMFDEGADRIHYKNWTRAKDVVLKGWKLNPDGVKCIDWYDIMKDLDWDLNFA